MFHVRPRTLIRLCPASSPIVYHLTDLEWYKDVLSMCVADKVITPDEESLLAHIKRKLDISDTQHQAILKELNYTPDEFASLKREDSWGRECVVCLDAPATHIILQCFHLCLCERCAKTLSLEPGSDKSCPECRAPIKGIHKTY